MSATLGQRRTCAQPKGTRFPFNSYSLAFRIAFGRSWSNKEEYDHELNPERKGSYVEREVMCAEELLQESRISVSEDVGATTYSLSIEVIDPKGKEKGSDER